jgi:hypothetical protein
LIVALDQNQLAGVRRNGGVEPDFLVHANNVQRRDGLTARGEQQFRRAIVRAQAVVVLEELVPLIANLDRLVASRHGFHGGHEARPANDIIRDRHRVFGVRAPPAPAIQKAALRLVDPADNAGVAPARAHDVADRVKCFCVA